jgi:hypothetical protein
MGLQRMGVCGCGCSRLFCALVLYFFLIGPTMVRAQTGGDAAVATPAACPHAIYVADFSLAAEADDEGATRRGSLQLRKRLRETLNEAGPGKQESPQEKAATILETLAQSIVDTLKDKKIQALRAPALTQPSEESWLLQGEFMEYDEGSRMKRAIIGFGSGSATMEVHITLSASAPGSSSVLLDQDMDGKKKRMPGAAVTKNPYVAAAKFVMQKNAPEREVKKLGSEIAHTVYKSLQDQGCVTP